MLQTAIKTKLAQYADQKQQALEVMATAHEDSFLYARANFWLAWLEVKTAVLMCFVEDETRQN